MQTFIHIHTHSTCMHACTVCVNNVHSLTYSSIFLLPLPSLPLQPGEGLYHKLMQHKQSIYMQISLLTSEYLYGRHPSGPLSYSCPHFKSAFV